MRSQSRLCVSMHIAVEHDSAGLRPAGVRLMVDSSSAVPVCFAQNRALGTFRRHSSGTCSRPRRTRSTVGYIRLWRCVGCHGCKGTRGTL